MNKKIIFITLILALLFIAGCGQANNSKVDNINCVKEGESLGAVVPGNNNECCSGLKAQIPERNGEKLVGTRGICVRDSSLDITSSKSNQEKSSGELTSNLKDLLSLGKSYSCTVQTAEGSATILIKGSSYKQQMTSQGVSITTISKDEGSKLCVYSITSAQGQNQCQKSCFGKVQGSESESDTANIKVKCSLSVISDSEFTTPNNCQELGAGAPPIDQGTPSDSQP